MKPQVSVIVPVYNVEKYLSRCLESLVHQTLASLEIIVINDGSTDHSKNIIKKYENDFPQRLVAYDKPNGGLSDARNFGLKFAQGDYIGFIDSDDYVELDMFESMLVESISKKALLTVCDIEYVYEDSERRYVLNGLRTIEGVPTLMSMFLSPLFAWNKLYHRSVFETLNFRFPLGLWYEDLPVTVPLLAHLEQVGYVPKAFVHYLQRSTSIMGTKNSAKLTDIFTVLDLVYRYYVDHGLIERFHDEIEYLHIEHLLLYGGFRFYRSDMAKLNIQRALTLLRHRFPNWRHNPYIQSTGKWYPYYLRSLNGLTWRFFQLLVKLKGR